MVIFFWFFLGGWTKAQTPCWFYHILFCKTEKKTIFILYFFQISRIQPASLLLYSVPSLPEPDSSTFCTQDQPGYRRWGVYHPRSVHKKTLVIIIITVVPLHKCNNIQLENFQNPNILINEAHTSLSHNRYTCNNTYNIVNNIKQHVVSEQRKYINQYICTLSLLNIQKDSKCLENYI